MFLFEVRFSQLAYNVYVYGKLRVCVRGISEGNSDVANVQRPLFKPNTSNFLYTVLANRILIKVTLKFY
ncbi:hypothetical protein FNB79_12100 [Formosa sediminum]|uniref:Uncharacterized protein n=1 Tax=Formosa sediminum TaxID=2594004 RepID=A0A516GT38_9FLAO|nr:hypothetical protein FNB79_12100 [Formosa sediminum]